MKIDLVPMAVLDQWKEAQSNFEGIQILDADIFPEKVFEDFRQRYQDSKRCHACSFYMQTVFKFITEVTEFKLLDVRNVGKKSCQYVQNSWSYKTSSHGAWQ